MLCVTHLQITAQSMLATFYNDLKHSLQKEIDSLVKWSSDNHMQINTNKTNSLLTRQKVQTLLTSTMPLDIDIGILLKVNINEHKMLGLLTDGNLICDSHIHVITKNVAQ